MASGFIVFSVGQKDVSDVDNKTHHISVMIELENRGLNFRELTVGFKNTSQRGFIVLNTEPYRKFVSGVGKQFNQDFYIKLDKHVRNMYKAYLISKTGEVSGLGFLRSMPKATIEDLELDYHFFRDDLKEHFTIWATDSLAGGLQQEIVALEAVKAAKLGVKDNHRYLSEH